MFVARVAVGHSHVGLPSTVVPDRRPGSSEGRYDSTVDALPSPSVFVTFHDAQALPEYLVTFSDVTPAEPARPAILGVAAGTLLRIFHY